MNDIGHPRAGTQATFCKPSAITATYFRFSSETPPSGITLLTASINCLINSAHCRNIDSHEWGICALSEGG